MSWQDQFTAYTTGMAFSLALSHDHVDLLAFIPNYDGSISWRNRNGRSSFIPTVNGLIRRGLVEHNAAARIVGFDNKHVKLKWVYRLTPAGERVLELIKLAGIVTDHHEPAVSETAA